MFRLNEELAVYVHRDAIDFRKNINGLAAIVEHGLKHDPFAPAVYVFRNRRRDRIKILGWYKNGFWLLMKRLEADRFIWPRAEEAIVNLSVEQLRWLLEGYDLAATVDITLWCIDAQVDERGLRIAGLSLRCVWRQNTKKNSSLCARHWSRRAPGKNRCLARSAFSRPSAICSRRSCTRACASCSPPRARCAYRTSATSSSTRPRRWRPLLLPNPRTRLPSAPTSAPRAAASPSIRTSRARSCAWSCPSPSACARSMAPPCRRSGCRPASSTTSSPSRCTCCAPSGSSTPARAATRACGWPRPRHASSPRAS